MNQLFEIPAAVHLDDRKENDNGFREETRKRFYVDATISNVYSTEFSIELTSLFVGVSKNMSTEKHVYTVQSLDTAPQGCI